MSEKTHQETATREQEIEDGIEELMEVIDKHPMSGTEVTQSDTIKLLRGIITSCNMRIETIRQEMGG